ncbi:MAG TPA: DMT family transporter [Microbacteriaceae bacterium]|nr:DMT family transporter [Microbacteriaceae bacterium]
MGTRWATLLFVALSVVGGALMVVQARMNAGLAVAEDSPWYAAAWSFGSGFLVVSVVVLLGARVRHGVARFFREIAAGRLPWWTAIGGTIGATFVLAQGLVAPAVGIALFTVVGVAGQSLGAVTVDRLGFLGMPRRGLTWPRLVGAVLVVIAVTVATWSELGGATAVWWLLLLPLANGLLRGVQQAINGRIREESGSAIAATFVNFGGGSIVLVVAAGIGWAVTGQGPVAIDEWWLLFGGLLGIVHIAWQSFGVRWLGTLVLGLAMIAGQLVTSVVLDLVLPLPGTAVDGWQVAGVALAFIAVLVAALPVRGYAGVKRSESEFMQ